MERKIELIIGIGLLMVLGYSILRMIRTVKRIRRIRRRKKEQGRNREGQKMRSRRKRRVRVVCLLGILAVLWGGYQIYQQQKIPESLQTFEEKYPEAADFVRDYPKRKHYQTIDLSEELEEPGIPFFLQWDKRWGYEMYGTDFLAVNGCGPTCLSMIVCGLTGVDTWNPRAVAEFSQEQGYYIPGEGTSWNLMTQGAAMLGLQTESVGIEADAIRQRLSESEPLICSMYPGDFTYTGHFIVLTGLDEEGKIVVHDPNSRVNSEKHWEMEIILPQIRQIWGYQMKNI